LEDDVILLVTSLGATFISKYLSENKFPFTIKRIIMLAPAFYDTDDVVLGTFHVHDSQYEGFLAQCQEMIIYHSSDDDEVPFSDSENYLKLFPHAEFKKFEKA
jgi:predicted alpha/beta hydrolase family esterase